MSRSRTARPLDVTRTRAALATFDAAADVWEADPSKPNDEAMEAARRAVGDAFAADTADRNNAQDVREFVLCLAGMTFVRRICSGVP